MARKSHKDVEFAVDEAVQGKRIRGRSVTDITREGTFKTFDEAAAYAVSLAVAHDTEVFVEVLVYSAAGARWYAGSDAVKQYREDPEASVFERLSVKATSHGMIP